MKAVSKTEAGGRQIVVFDQVNATIPTGVHIDKANAETRFTDGVIPAGTLIVKGNDGLGNVLNEALSATNVTKDTVIGLTLSDIMIDDYPLVSAVIAGTARKEALPDLEMTGVSFIQDALPRITFY